jgi:phospholipid transport system substrate-binding protein
MTSPRRFPGRWLAAFAFLAFLPLASIQPSRADTPAEEFVSVNIQKGLGILDDPALSAGEKSQQFEHLLLGITDIKRIAQFTLGQYARTAPQDEQDAFARAFQDYSIAVYRSYLGTYAGQTLKVIGSREHSPTDFVVATKVVDSNRANGQVPLEIDFRVRTDTGKPEVTDLGIAGIWLALEERDQFGAFLAQNHGDVRALAAHLATVAQGYRIDAALTPK